MTLLEIIKCRKSVRSFQDKPLEISDRDAIVRYISGMEAPFGASVRISMITTGTDGKPVKPGTYGVISGAREYLALLYRPSRFGEEAAGYVFEQLILHCTGLGLGTCWIGGTFRRSDFERMAEPGPGEELRIISPVGYARDKKTIVDSVFCAATGRNKRKDFGSLFFRHFWGDPLTEESAGVYALPLGMLRLAPSASNKQPWRVVLAPDGTLHFYRYPDLSKFTRIDMGIAMCHFEQSCRVTGIAGRFEYLPSPSNVPHDSGAVYVMSWVGAR